MDFTADYLATQRLVNDELERFFVENCPQGELLEAMRYSLLAGGKRIRPVLLIKFCEACGGTAEQALAAACAVEMLHTYSLIHDDLPCMDNDTLRRGKPTCHTVFGETTAVLAGDALQAAAFRTLLQGTADRAAAAEMGAVLAEAAGERGMCGGQYLDMNTAPDGDDEESLRLLQSLKTGALLDAACRMGAICGGGSAEQCKAASEYARFVGAAFQIRDDVLDVTSTTQELGKNVGSDAQNGKLTFATLLGVQACERLVASCTERARTLVRAAVKDSAFLEWMAQELSDRKK